MGQAPPPQPGRGGWPTLLPRSETGRAGTPAGEPRQSPWPPSPKSSPRWTQPNSAPWKPSSHRSRPSSSRPDAPPPSRPRSHNATKKTIPSASLPPLTDSRAPAESPRPQRSLSPLSFPTPTRTRTLTLTLMTLISTSSTRFSTTLTTDLTFRLLLQHNDVLFAITPYTL